MEQRAIFKCLDEYAREDGLKCGAQYISLHLLTKPYTCDICKIRFSNETDLINHKQIHAVRRNRCRNDCKITFQAYTSLYDHIYKEHGGFHKHTCPYCFKNYRRYLNYYYHVIQEHECVHCDICLENHFDYPTLLEHYKKRHFEDKKREIERYNRSQKKKFEEHLENSN